MANTVKGVAPGFILTPAREYEWELRNRISIKIPNEGNISDLLHKEELANGVRIAGEDEFCILSDNTLLLWEIIRVLFAKSEYPNLKEDECFNVLALKFEDGEVILHGEVLGYV